LKEILQVAGKFGFKATKKFPNQLETSTGDQLELKEFGWRHTAGRGTPAAGRVIYGHDQFDLETYLSHRASQISVKELSAMSKSKKSKKEAKIQEPVLAERAAAVSAPVPAPVIPVQPTPTPEVKPASIADLKAAAPAKAAVTDFRQCEFICSSEPAGHRCPRRATHGAFCKTHDPASRSAVVAKLRAAAEQRRLEREKSNPPATPKAEILSAA
jgi:hypothetical protein